MADSFTAAELAAIAEAEADGKVCRHEPGCTFSVEGQQPDPRRQAMGRRNGQTTAAMRDFRRRASYLDWNLF